MHTSYCVNKEKKLQLTASCVWGKWLCILASVWKRAGEKGGGVMAWKVARPRGGLAVEGERQEPWLSGSLDVAPCTREEVEQQRRAGVTRLTHCSWHLFQSQWVTTASLCLACVRFVHVSGKEWTAHMSEVYLSHRSPCFSFVPLVSLLSRFIMCVCIMQTVCVLMSGALWPLPYHACPLVNHSCPGQPCGRHQAVLSLTSPSQ